MYFKLKLLCLQLKLSNTQLDCVILTNFEVSYLLYSSPLTIWLYLYLQFCFTYASFISAENDQIPEGRPVVIS